jgi:hypothetical protein
MAFLTLDEEVALGESVSSSGVDPSAYDVYAKLYKLDEFPRKLSYLEELFDWCAPHARKPYYKRVGTVLKFLLSDKVRWAFHAFSGVHSAAALSRHSTAVNRNRGLTPVQAYHHLLIWALLTNKFKLARIFWLRGGATALQTGV